MNNLHVVLLKKKINSKYILALINSALVNFYFQYLNPETGEALAEVKKETVEKLLIKNTTNQQPFITLVDKIIQQKHSGKDTTALEAHIDQMVYALYNLTYDEACMIHGNTTWMRKKDYEAFVHDTEKKAV